MKRVFAGFVLIILSFNVLFAEKIKVISDVVGVRDNQLLGYGLVVGLNGTGDKENFSMQTLANMLDSMDIKINPASIKAKNAAAVIITAKIPAFASQGDKLDILVSSVGDAGSLQGGTLIMTPLRGVDGSIYAVAQGSISVGTQPGRGGGGGGVHKLAATIPGGAIVERELTYDIYSKKTAKLSLHDSDFQNSIKIQDKINRFFGFHVASSIDPRTVQLTRPKDLSMVEFLALVQDIDIDYKVDEKIVINERTGTIVAGADITVEPIVVSHGSITIEVSNEKDSTEKAKGLDMDKGISVDINTNLIKSTGKKATVASLARALQKLGATPGDIIAIFQSIKDSGAVNAELRIL